MIDIARTLSGTIANIMKRERTSRKIRKILSPTAITTKSDLISKTEVFSFSVFSTITAWSLISDSFAEVRIWTLECSNSLIKVGRIVLLSSFAI